MRTRLTHAWCFAAVLAVLLAPSARAQCNDCWLEVSGTEIVNAATGQPVILRAVGLGYWLLQEGYMLNPRGATAARARSGR
jgi:hypothetical protein